MTTVPTTARPTPQDRPAPAVAEPPHAAAGATLYQPYMPDCPWCADVGLVLVATVSTGRADWSPALVVVCVCRASWSAA